MGTQRQRHPWLSFLLLSATTVAFGQNVVMRPNVDDHTNDYRVTVLVSDEEDEAPLVDPLLVNAWGIAASDTSPWWVANNGTGTSTVYTGDGTKIPGLEPSVPGQPTGTVFNTSSTFQMADGVPAKFIFASLDGKFSAWNGDVNPNAVVVHDEPGSVYIALAIHGDTLYSPNFATCEIEAFRGNFFDDSFAEVDLPGGFEDKSVPTGYCPFGIQAIGDSIFVAYAKVGPDGDEEHGVGLGAVREFDTDGNFVSKIADHGPFNAPWGMAKAPADWGRFSGCLIVGNFGDGTITGWCEKRREKKWRFAGYLRDKGPKIFIDGLWGIGFGNGHNSGPQNVLYFAAGPDGESHGYYGKIEFHPEE